jgi:hypothetical protein
MRLGPESARRLTEELATLYREHVSSEQFETEFYRRHPKPRSLLWASVVLLPLLPISLGLLGIGRCLSFRSHGES